MGVDAEVYALHISGDTYTEGEVVEATARVSLSGFAEERQEFFVGFSVKDPDGNWRDNDGTTGSSIEVDPGNTVPIHLEWEVEGQAPVGTYEARSALWTDHPDDGGEFVDDEDEEEAFNVIEEEAEEYDLTVEADGNGSVGINPPGLSTDGTTQTYEGGTEVELTANPHFGHKFDKWIGDVPNGDSDDESISVTIDQHKDIVAVFEEEAEEYDLTVEADGNGSVRINPPGLSTDRTTETYGEGTEVDLSANSDNGYKFFKWDGDVPSGDSTDESITVVMDGDNQLTAEFEKEEDDEFTASVISINSVTSTYSLGQVVEIAYKITNESDLSGGVEVELILEGPEGEEYSATNSHWLSANQEGDGNVQWELPEGVTTGPYNVMAEVSRNGDDKIVDHDLRRGLFTVEAESTEIDIANVEISDRKVVHHDQISIEVDIEHSHQQDFFVGFGISIYDSSNGEFEVTSADISQTTIETEGAKEVEEDWIVPSEIEYGQCDLIVEVYPGSEGTDGDRIDRSVHRDIFDVIPLDEGHLVLNAIDPRGIPVTDAEFSLYNQDGTIVEAANRTSSTSFTDLSTGDYTLEVRSQTLHQIVKYDVTIGPGENPFQVLFEPAEPIEGVIMSEEEGMLVSGATITVVDYTPKLSVGIDLISPTEALALADGYEIEGISVISDDSGSFITHERIPDGEYKLAIDVPNGERVTETVQMGFDRHARLTAPFNLEPPDNVSDIVEDTNYLVSIIIRNFEQNDVPTSVQMPFIHQYGIATGTVDALQDIVEDLRNLLDINISEFIDTVHEIAIMIADDPWVIKELASMMVEGFMERQREANPFPSGTPRHLTFKSGWISSYVVVNFAIGWAVGAGAGHATRVAASSTRLKQAVSGMKTVINDASDGLPSTAAITRRVQRSDSNSRSNRGEAAGASIGAFHRIVNDIDNKLFEYVMFSYWQINRRTPDIDDGIYLKYPFGGSNIGNIKGDVGEILFASELRSGSIMVGTTVSRVFYKFPTKNGSVDWEKLPDDTPFAVTNVGKTEWETEVDILVLKKSVDNNSESDLEIVEAHAVTVGTDKDAYTNWSQTKEKLQNLREGVKSGRFDPNSLESNSGIPYRVFGSQKESDDYPIYSAGPKGETHDNNFDFTSDDFRDVAKHGFDNADDLQQFFPKDVIDAS